MRWAILGPLERLGTVLVDPRGAMARSVADPMPGRLSLAFLIVAVGLGVATLPRQLPLLEAAFPLLGDPAVDVGARMMRRGLTRLIVADRLVPTPTLLLAALLFALAAEPVLVLARERRAALWSVAVIGLAPVLVLRIGELALTWLTTFSAGAPPGEIIALPHRFRTGPALLWMADPAPPAWLERLDATVNAMSVWTVALWAVGVSRLDDGARWSPWHVGLPAACLIGGALVTWVVAPVVLAAILGGP